MRGNKRKNRRVLFFSLLLALCFLFASCSSEPEPDFGNSDSLFSHKSGVYPKSFSLTLQPEEGNTVYYSIDGSVPSKSKVDNKFVFEYSSPITVKDRNGQPNILATMENIAKMYPHPDDPERAELIANGEDDWLPKPYFPTAEQVPKATVIRAVEVNSSGKQSRVMTRTYFIGDNLANYGNHPVISLVTEPQNLVDDDTGIYVTGHGRTRNDYNWAQRGREWEREANLEFFDASKNVAIAAGAGIRVRGGYSRASGQKSFNVFFRDEYGLNSLRNYNLIPGAVLSDGKTPVPRYKHFMLRNGGNDADYTKLRDVYAQNLFTDRNFTVQAAIPCIVYLNGEYWGFYNLQEKYSNNSIDYKYGVNKDNVVSVKNWELEEGIESDMGFYWTMMDFAYKDMSNNNTYNDFCGIVDIQSFIDYYAAQIYVANEDWPDNNNQLWRTRNTERGNPYGDTKWRWMMFDLDMVMGIYSGGKIIDAIQRLKDMAGGNALLFTNLLNNQDFCRRFVITMMDLYNVNFDYNSNVAKLNEMAAVYKPLMGETGWQWIGEGLPPLPSGSKSGTYYSRWGFPWDWYSYDAQIEDMKKYLSNIRPAMTGDYLPKHFGHLGIAASKLFNVTLSASGTNNGSIKINTTTPNLRSGTWTGKYYSTYPVTVTANVPDGYSFSGWTVTGGAAVNPSSPTTEVTFNGNVQITANYSVK